MVDSALMKHTYRLNLKGSDDDDDDDDDDT
jgi:hypothetical protein